MVSPAFSSSRNVSQVAHFGTSIEFEISTRGAAGWVRNTPTGLPDWTSRVSSSPRPRSVRTIASNDSQSRAAFPVPPYTTRSSGRSATSGSRLFMSIRSAASCGHPRHDSSAPRGALISRPTELPFRLPSNGQVATRGPMVAPLESMTRRAEIARPVERTHEPTTPSPFPGPSAPRRAPGALRAPQRPGRSARARPGDVPPASGCDRAELPAHVHVLEGRPDLLRREGTARAGPRPGLPVAALRLRLRHPRPRRHPLRPDPADPVRERPREGPPRDLQLEDPLGRVSRRRPDPVRPRRVPVRGAGRRALLEAGAGQVEHRGEGHPDDPGRQAGARSEEHTSELQSRENLVCRLLLEKKKKKK